MLTIFPIMCALVHMLPPEVLGMLGTISDVVSDFSPAIIRPVEHVIFTLMLN